MTGFPWEVSLQRAHDEVIRGRAGLALEQLSDLPAEAMQREEYWWVRSRAELDTDRPAAAVTTAQQGLSVFPTATSLLGVLGNAYLDLDQVADAEKAFLSSLALDPRDAYVLSRYAVLCATNGQTSKADRLVERASAIDPEMSVVRRSRALIAFIDGDDESARGEVAQLLANQPDDPLAHSLEAHLSAERGRLSDLGRSMERLAAADPETYADAGWQARHLGHPAMAPIRLLSRIGRIRIYLTVAAIVIVASALDQPIVASAAALGYLLVVVYSWTVPPLLRRWLRWRRR